MNQQYSLQEIGTYTLELRAIETQCQGWAPNTETGKQYRAIAHVMREVLLRMHESIEKNGPRRPGFFKVVAKYDKVNQHYLGSRTNLLPPISPDKLKAADLSIKEQDQLHALGTHEPIRMQHPDQCQYPWCGELRPKLQNYCAYHTKLTEKK